MFKFLRKKLKSTIEKFSKKIEEESEEEEQIEEEKEEEKVEKPEKKEVKEEKTEEEKVEKPEKEEVEKEPKEEEKEKPKQGILKKIKEKVTTRRINEKKFEKLFNDLEVMLLENNVAVEVVDKIKESLKIDLVDIGVRGNISNAIRSSLKEDINDVLQEVDFDLIKAIKNKKDEPYVVVFVGVNGSGKTTTMAKIANLLKNKGFSIVFSASDTFRAASVEQLKVWGDKLNIKTISHKYGSDPTAVAFDSLSYCRAHKKDVLLIDTAGRQHKNTNLMDEMKKIVRVIKPDLKIFVGESIIGNDAVEQSKNFNKAIDINGVILTKADIDNRGGAIISISYIIGKPIIYMGNGQNLENLEKFNKNKIMESLGF